MAMLRSEGNMSLKNPVAPPRIDPGTVRLVAQRLNHYATPGPNQSHLAQVKKRVELYIYSPSGPSWPVHFTFTFYVL